jgi:hypothetical protein
MPLLKMKAWLPTSAALITAGRDVGRGIVILGRGTIGMAGILTLSAAVAVLGSEQAREQVLAVAGSLAAPGPAVATASTGVTDSSAERDARADRRGGWPSAQPVVAVDPAQERVTRYLSRRYRVAENAVRQIVGEAFHTGRSIGIDPMLILAVTAVESSLNPFAQSPVGAQGLMQVLTHVHSDKFLLHGGDHAALDPIANLRVGSEILKDLIQRGGSVERGLQLYVGAGNLPDDGGYAARVLGEMARIKLAAGTRPRDALAAGPAVRIGVGRSALAADLQPLGAAPFQRTADSNQRPVS